MLKSKQHSRGKYLQHFLLHIYIFGRRNKKVQQLCRKIDKGFELLTIEK